MEAALDRAEGRRALVARALQHEADALRAFVAARLPASEVEDVLQSAAERALERAASLRDADRVVPWLFRLHRNAVTDSHRRMAADQRRFGDGAILPDELPVEEAEADICACSLSQARSLRPSYAAILGLVDAGGHSLREAAGELGISVNNATVRLHRARAALRKAMFEHCGVERAQDCWDCRCAHDGCCPG